MCGLKVSIDFVEWRLESPDLLQARLPFFDLFSDLYEQHVIGIELRYAQRRLDVGHD
jgi:hypothetical protein